MTGRPLKYKTPEELQEMIDDNGFPLVGLDYIFDVFKKSDFKQERDLVEYIENNIEDFCNDALGIEFSKYEKEYRINGVYNKSKIDFLIKTKNRENVFIECKNPVKGFSELHKSVSQILSYIVQLDKVGIGVNRFYLVSTRFDLTTMEIIEQFNLPIRVILVNKKHIAEYKYNLLTHKKEVIV